MGLPLPELSAGLPPPCLVAPLCPAAFDGPAKPKPSTCPGPARAAAKNPAGCLATVRLRALCGCAAAQQQHPTGPVRLHRPRHQQPPAAAGPSAWAGALALAGAYPPRAAAAGGAASLGIRAGAAPLQPRTCGRLRLLCLPQCQPGDGAAGVWPPSSAAGAGAAPAACQHAHQSAGGRAFPTAQTGHPVRRAAHRENAARIPPCALCLLCAAQRGQRAHAVHRL